jgi:non-specific serine/threonine protein kinase
LYWGLVAIFTAPPAVACERLAEGVAMCRQLGFRSLGARALYLMGLARLELGDPSGARAALEEALPTSLELGDAWIIAQQIGTFAALAASTGRPGQALRLAGFQAAYSRAHEFSVPTVIRAKLDSWIAPARQALGPRAAALFRDGERLTLEQAVASALEQAAEPGARPAPREKLTAREQEVARLVATGRANREIAAELCLSVRTVEVHVDHILTKLDFTTRTQLAAWMHRQDLMPKDT